MKLKTNSDQITEANSARWWLLSIGVEQMTISMVERNDGPSAPNCVVDIELVPSMGNLVPFLGQLFSTIFGGTPSLKPMGLCKSMGNQVTAHGQFGSEVLNGVIANGQCFSIWNADALQRDSEQLAFHVSPLSNGAPKPMIEGNGFLGNIHSKTTKTPNVAIEPRR